MGAGGGHRKTNRHKRSPMRHLHLLYDWSLNWGALIKPVNYSGNCNSVLL